MRKPKRAKQPYTARTIYEAFNGERVTDSHWSRINKACHMAGITMDAQSMKLLFQLRKVSPHLVSNVLALKCSQPDPVGATSSAGKEVFKKIKAMGVNPNLSTLYRWFYRLGVDFSASTIYDAPTVALVLLQAQIYLMKKKRINYGKN